MVNQHLNKVKALYYTTPSFTKKGGAHVPYCRSTESSNILAVNSLMEAFFTKVKGLESFPAILLKKDSTTEIFLHGFWKVALFKLSGSFLRDIFAKHYPTMSQASTLFENNELEKNKEN